jgi:hypothetical protein
MLDKLKSVKPLSSIIISGWHLRLPELLLRNLH